MNGEPVTLEALRRLLAEPRARWQLEQEPGAANQDKENLHRLAVRKLIHRRLYLQEASRQRITVSEQALDQTVMALRSRFADLGSFAMWMKESGFDDRSLFSSLRDDMLVTNVVASLVTGVEVTGQEVQDYYATHIEDLSISEEVRLRTIVVNSRTAAREILTALRNGGNFSHLARQRSMGVRAAQGGDTGWVNAGTLTPPLRNVVDMLKPGEASSPLQKNNDEFLIIALAGRRPVRAKNLDEARPEIEQRLLATKQQETVRAWLTQQEQKTNIEVFPQPNELFPGSQMTLSGRDGI